MRPRLYALLLACIGLTSIPVVAGPISRVGRTPAPITTQAAAVPGRVTSWTESGVRTTHAMQPQARVIEGVIERASLHDPLVMHRTTLAGVRATAGKLAPGDFVPVAGKGYEFILPVSGKSWAVSVHEVAPDFAASLLTRTMAPANAKLIEGRWFLEVGGKSVPVRPPLIRRTGRFISL